MKDLGMDQQKRYRIKLADSMSYDEAVRILEDHACVLLTNPRRNTIAATQIDDLAAEQLRRIDATIMEDNKFDQD